MNILIAANYATPNSGNFIASLLELGQKLRENGDNVYFIFPDTENTRKSNGWVSWLRTYGFNVSLIDLSISEDKQLEYLKSQISKNSIDILHIHFGLFHNFALHYRKELKCKIIVHEHMGYPLHCSKFKQSIKYMLRSVYYRLKRIGIISVNKYINRVHCFARHWYVPNGLSLMRNVIYSKTRDEKRAEFGFKDSEKVILFLGWSPEIKGLDIAVKAVSILRERGINAVLAVIGAGAGQNISKSIYDFILSRTSLNPLSEWIRYTPGGEDIFAIDRMADVYLSSSRTEAFSYGSLEAISQNVPVVVSDIKGTSWCWEYSKSFVYPVEDADACADAILKALETDNTTSNSEKLLDRYSIEKWCSRIIAIYNAL